MSSRDLGARELTGVERAAVAAVREGMPRAIADLSALVRIPSVSWSAFDAARVAESAEAVADLARETGFFDEVSVRRAPTERGVSLGQPAVVARRAARNGRPTVLLYAHHDVQPPGADDEWHTPPYEPTVRGDRLYGRGTADDKAGVMAHIAAIRALAESTESNVDLGVVLFVEGEEEYGSRSFGPFLAQNRADLAADVIVIADSDNWDVTTPALTVALRGNVTFRLTVRTLAHASHSGMFGGVAPDALLAMVQVLSTLHDESGSVAVPGLASHDAEVPDYPEEDFRTAAAVLDGVRLLGRGSIARRLWYQPAITITGIDAPSVANASNTLVPAVSARISVRIAPGDDARSAFEAVRDHLVSRTPFGAHVEIDDVDEGSPFLIDTNGWAVTDVKQAMRDAWGVPPVETGIGGSIPFVSQFAREFPEAQILITGVEDPDTRAHSPNESLHLGVFARATLTEALFLVRLNSRTSS